jgi:toxin ParE1/3/4
LKRARFSRQAAADVEEIASFIARDDIDAALRFYNQLDHLRNRLARFAHLGRERPELAPGLRSFPLESYLVYYLPTPDGVVIARVLSGLRDIGPDYFIPSERGY